MALKPKDDPLEGQVVDGRFRLLHRIGAGGMSVVYRAEPAEGGAPLAVKFLRSAFANLPDFVRRFEQEAKACSLLKHPSCVSVRAFGFAFGSPYLVLEHLEGRLLAEVVARGPVPVRRAIRITRELLSGLSHAHGRGVVHRDLKPGNIMLVSPADGGDPTAKIMDFGTAQLLDGEGGGARRRGTEVGTPWYMAPEQAAGQPTDPRTDLYAVGVMLFEMLTGERPYTAEDPHRVLEMHLSSPIPSARALKPEMGLSPELEAVMVRALQKQPDDRFASADEFDEALALVPEITPRRKTGSLSALPAVDEEAPPGSAPRGATESAARDAAAGAADERTERRQRVLLIAVASVAALGLLLLLLVLTGVLR